MADNYTAKDFERYYAGQMPEADMHALEKSALADAFLADALEGYRHTKSPLKDTAELRNSLLKDIRKNRPFVFRTAIWFRLAASIIAFVGVGLLIYQSNSRHIVLAKNDVKPTTITRDSKSISKPDSTNNTAVVINDVKDSIIKQSYHIKSYHQINTRSEISSGNSAGVTKQDTMLLAQNKSSLPEVKINLLKGRVVDDQGNAIGYATVYNKDRSKTTVTDSEGRFKLASNDTLVTATIAAAGYKTKQSQLAPGATKNIELEQDNKRLDEVVVTANGINRKAKDMALPRKLAAKVAGVSISDSMSGPQVGWQKFYQYISKNSKIPMSESGVKYAGKVVLSFYVNKRGRPGNLKTEQSLCAECDKEAARLLITGPKWKYLSGKRYFVDIPF